MNSPRKTREPSSSSNFLASQFCAFFMSCMGVYIQPWIWVIWKFSSSDCTDKNIDIRQDHEDPLPPTSNCYWQHKLLIPLLTQMMQSHRLLTNLPGCVFDLNHDSSHHQLYDCRKCPRRNKLRIVDCVLPNSPTMREKTPTARDDAERTSTAFPFKTDKNSGRAATNRTAVWNKGKIQLVGPFDINQATFQVLRNK